MLDSLVRVTRRVGRVPEAEAPLTGVAFVRERQGPTAYRGSGRDESQPTPRIFPGELALTGRTLALREAR